jgi:hypothetical protein
VNERGGVLLEIEFVGTAVDAQPSAGL